MPAPRELDPTHSVAAFLGHKVRTEREKLGWRQEDLAAKVFISRVRITKIELGDDPPNPTLARRLDQVLGLGSDLENLSKLLDNAQVRDYAKLYLARQLEAVAMHDFSIVVPGLLQTEEYARALMLVGQAGDPAEIDRYVVRRIARQEVWARSEPPWMWTILDAAVLRRRVTSDRDGMRKQIEKLREMSELPHINVQILPDAAPMVAGSFSLVTLSNGDRGAYTEGFETGAYTEEPSRVARFQRVYDRLHAYALSEDASTVLIEKAIKEYS